VVARAWRIAAAVLGTLGLVFVGGCATRHSEPEYLYGVPEVWSLDVTVSDETPARADVIVRGAVRDACTQIYSVRQSFDEGVFSLTLTTRRSLSGACADAETPFEKTVPLLVRGLETGEYTVVAGDASTTFLFRREGTAPQL